ncbi:hypothetical protein BGLA2_220004 [Burkholderia gladioli]|nr:hypothetical protein BGLA2_220004 [Burkholderia gladioli]
MIHGKVIKRFEPPEFPAPSIPEAQKIYFANFHTHTPPRSNDIEPPSWNLSSKIAFPHMPSI